MTKSFARLILGASLLVGCTPPPAGVAPAQTLDLRTGAAMAPALLAPPPAPPPEPGAPLPGGMPSPPGSEQSYISVTPLTMASTSFDTTVKDRFTGAYTRLVVQADVSAGGSGGTAGVLPYTGRSALARFLFGQHTSLNLTAKVTAGQFVATVPLVTLDHVSNSTSGEVFTRLVSHLAQNYPFFLVRRDGGNAVVSVQFSLKANDSVTSSAAGTALSVAQNVAQLVSPASAVVTTLTQQATKDVAAAIDQAIGRLFTTSLDEEHLLDQDIGRWPPTGGATVTLKIPAAEGDWTSGPADKTVGTWTIQFEAPKPSIFSDIEICDAGTPPAGARCRNDYATAAADGEKAVSPNEVLSFQLINGAQNLGTVATYLKQKDWYTAALSGFASTGGVTAGSVGQFCRSIKGSITDLGLNAVDAGIVADSVRRGLALPKAVTDQMSATADCALVYPIGA